MLNKILQDNNAEIDRLSAIEKEHLEQAKNSKNVAEARNSIHAARMVAKIMLDIEQENQYLRMRMNSHGN